MLALQDTVAVPDPVMLLGDIAPHVSPAGAVSVNETMSVNPLTEVRFIVELVVWRILTGAGVDAEIMKFGGCVRNSVIGVAAASFGVRLVRFQLTSIVLVREYWLYRCAELKPVFATGPAQIA